MCTHALSHVPLTERSISHTLTLEMLLLRLLGSRTNTCVITESEKETQQNIKNTVDKECPDQNENLFP